MSYVEERAWEAAWHREFIAQRERGRKAFKGVGAAN
jgi:hypothetical protein